MKLMMTKATKRKKARTGARMGHGPEGGAWIDAWIGNIRGMERDEK
jgi:hypothetical protein